MYRSKFNQVMKQILKRYRYETEHKLRYDSMLYELKCDTYFKYLKLDYYYSTGEKKELLYNF